MFKKTSALLLAFVTLGMLQFASANENNLVLIQSVENQAKFPGGGWGPSQYSELTCISHYDNSSYCNVGFQVRQVVMIRQESHTACIYGQTWWPEAYGVTVSSGCRAHFGLYGY